MQAVRGNRCKPVGCDRHDRGSKCLASFAQERLWLEEQLRPGHLNREKNPTFDLLKLTIETSAFKLQPSQCSNFHISLLQNLF